MAHRLADGTPLELGMRVVDYDRKHGFIEDSEQNRKELAMDHANTTYVGGRTEVVYIDPPMDGRTTCDAWFWVVRDDGGRSSMDCSRMIAEGGRLDK